MAITPFNKDIDLLCSAPILLQAPTSATQISALSSLHSHVYHQEFSHGGKGCIPEMQKEHYLWGMLMLQYLSQFREILPKRTQAPLEPSLVWPLHTRSRSSPSLPLGFFARPSKHQEEAWLALGGLGSRLEIIDEEGKKHPNKFGRIKSV